MRFYTQQHRHYCGIDLHARSMFVCILDRSGKTLVHKKIDCDRDELLQAFDPTAARTSPSPSSVSSAGIGSPTYAPRRGSNSSSVMPST